MKKIIILLVLLLLAGCSENNFTERNYSQCELVSLEMEHYNVCVTKDMFYFCRTMTLDDAWSSPQGLTIRTRGNTIDIMGDLNEGEI